MLKLVGDTDAQTLVIALVSGGGSALLEDSWVPLEDLVAVSKSLSAAGAPIESLNTVRRALSRVKAGGFARHVLEHSSASLVGLIISDVIGDDLEMVASGPTVLSADDVGDRRRAAIGVLEKYRLDNGPESIQRFLNLEVPTQIGKTSDEANHGRVRNHLLANNTTAIEAAARYASRKGALVSSPGFDINRGVEAVAKDWAALAMSRMEAGVAEPLIFLAGGEPTVSLCESPGQGGRNLQLAALVLRNLLESWPATDVPVAFISGGSDGEDGNVSVSGGGFEGALLRVLAGDPSLRELLWAGIAGNDCYTFFDRVGRLLAPSPVSTNVCDIQVMLFTQQHDSLSALEKPQKDERDRLC